MEAMNIALGIYKWLSYSLIFQQLGKKKRKRKKKRPVCVAA